MHFGKRNPRLRYFLNETRVASVSSVKDLGVVVSVTLDFFVHTERIVHRAGNFLRRTEYRCKLPRHALEMVDVIDRLYKIDMKMFRKIIEEKTSFDELSVLRHSHTRNGFIVSAHSVPETVPLEEHFAWGMAKVVNT